MNRVSIGRIYGIVMASRGRTNCINSGRGAVIVVQHATQALTPLD
jgi:hypothetical protein